MSNQLTMVLVVQVQIGGCWLEHRSNWLVGWLLIFEFANVFPCVNIVCLLDVVFCQIYFTVLHKFCVSESSTQISCLAFTICFV